MKASVGFGVPSRDRAPSDWEEKVQFVVAAERMGVHSAWSAEAWGSDAVTPLGFLAARTSTILLGTGIIQAGTRTPALVAVTAVTLQGLSEGRFLLGLGASGPQVIEGWHGLAFDRPLQRMREIVEIVQLVASGERLEYHGQTYELPRPGGEGKSLRLSLGAVDPIPIYLATLGPKSLEWTGEVADGWLGTSFMPEHADVFFNHIQAGADRTGRSLHEIDLQAGGVVAFADDVESLYSARKPGIAFTLGAMGSRRHNFYNEAFRRAGYEELAAHVQDLWLQGQRQEAIQLIPDEIVIQTNLLGTDQMVKDRIRAYRDCGVTTIRVDPSGADLGERLKTLERFMDLLEAVNAEGQDLSLNQEVTQ